MSQKQRRGARVTRRRVMRAGGAIAAVAALGLPAIAAGKVFKLGYVSPQTGPLAPFGEADSFVLAQVRASFERGVKSGGSTVPVEIVVKDSQSNPNRAAEVAADLINNDQVDLMLVASTPETTNPVSDQCEVNEVPCVSSVAPWQPWFFARGGKPESGFKYTYHFFWGLEDVIAVYTNMWKQLATDKVVGGLFPNDGDGNAWGDNKLGFPPVLDKEGYKLIDPGRFQNLTDNFSAQIAAFKQGNVEIVTGVVIPPDWTTFWTQANQQGFRPKIASVGKALLFPSAIEALGDKGQNLSTEVWWTPNHPFKSSLTGQSAKQLAGAYTAATKKQWTQPIGFAHALFEVAADIMKRAKAAGDRAAVLDALVKTDLQTIVGPIAWGKGPVKNVAKTPLVGGQWRRGGAFKYDLVITSNETAPSIPAGGKMEPIA
ncbi:MAG TPA: ABC transporter substrate-binding protein [Stellaceae bacterium]|jgi:branched-chain amino acid transport system substrate-binding protein|nr:ABC transporter substrate-binding protein [Stellaceae bacterium]